MNRKLLLTLALIFFVTELQAQPLFRLESFSRYRYDWNGKLVLNDTVHYHFTGGNGGTLPVNTFLPELYSSVDLRTAHRTFLYDSAYMQIDDWGTNKLFNNKQKINNGFVEVFTNDLLTPYTTKMDSVTYIGHPVTSIITYKRYMGAWAVSKDSFAYDNNGNLLVHLLDNINSTKGDEKWEYQYNANNQVTQVLNSYKGNVSMRYTYSYSNNLLASESRETYYGGSWNIEGITTYTYDGAGKLIETELLDAANTPLSKLIYSYDGAGNITEVKRMKWNTATGSYFNLKRALWTYNTYNLPLSAFNEHYDTSSGTWLARADTGYHVDDYIQHFHYQLYWPAGITETSKNTTLTIYPIPASDFVNINVEWKEPQTFTVSIIDIEGKVVKQWSEEKIKKYSKSVALPELLPGNYFIKMTGGKEQAVQKLIILK